MVNPIIEKQVQEGLGFFNNEEVRLRVNLFIRAGFTEEEAKRFVADEFGLVYIPAEK